jgi:hypothetical protein
MRNSFNNLARKPKKRISLWRYTCRLVDKIKIYPKEIEFDVKCIELPQDRFHWWGLVKLSAFLISVLYACKS